MKELAERYKVSLEEIISFNKENELFHNKGNKKNKQIKEKQVVVSEKQLRALRVGGRYAS